MKYSLFAPCLLSVALAACGGGGGADSASAPSTSAPLSQAFVAPAAGTTLVFDETLSDNLDNTINRTLVETVSKVHADGSFTITKRDASDNTVFLGAADYTYYPHSIELDASGHTKQYVISYPNGTSNICLVSRPTNSTASQPNTWNVTYTETCGTRAPVTYSRSGAYVGTETVTVPAGTFNADKYQNTYIWTDTAGTTITETTTSWYDAPATGAISLKYVASYAYSGTTARPNSIVSSTRVLRSRH